MTTLSRSSSTRYAPFAESQRLLAAKFDLEIAIEGNVIVCNSSKSNQELRQELTKSIKKIEDSYKAQIRRIRNQEVARIKKLTKIISTDDVHRLSKAIDEAQLAYNEKVAYRCSERIKELTSH